jgi:hypothetical protein
MEFGQNNFTGSKICVPVLTGIEVLLVRAAGHENALALSTGWCPSNSPCSGQDKPLRFFKILIGIICTSSTDPHAPARLSPVSASTTPDCAPARYRPRCR